MLTKLIAKYYDLICKEDIQICSRKDFFLFLGIRIFVFLIFLIVVNVLDVFSFPNIFYLPLFIFSLLMDISLIILSVKRLHDANFSGFFILIPIVSIVLVILPSDKKNNKYIKKEISDEDKRENENLEKFIEALNDYEIKEK